jgi:hypothetical protein
LLEEGDLSGRTFVVTSTTRKYELLSGDYRTPVKIACCELQSSITDTKDLSHELNKMVSSAYWFIEMGTGLRYYLIFVANSRVHNFT